MLEQFLNLQRDYPIGTTILVNADGMPEDKEQVILSELREIRMKLIKIHSEIVGNERCVDEDKGSPSCLVENVAMNMHLISDINAIVNSINEILF